MSDKCHGVVKRWNRDKAFGFIERDDGREIFVHLYALKCAGSPGLNEGEEVEFIVTGDGDRDRALHVTAPGGGLLPGYPVAAHLKSLPVDVSTACSKCGSFWHLSRNCPGPHNREQWVRCYRCLKLGHRTPDCPKKREEEEERARRDERREARPDDRRDARREPRGEPRGED
eukprot:EG_transcript_36198